MCWVSKNLNKKIADKDIICYKECSVRINKDRKRWQFWKSKYIILSQFYSYKYKINKLNPLIYIKYEICTRHSGDRLYIIRKGYHSYKYPSRECNVKCIIPKGTVYYDDGNILVSETIKVIKVIKATKVIKVI